MKRFVRSDFGTTVVLTAATVLVVAITRASAGATYLIAFGFLAVAIAWQRFNEPAEEVRELPEAKGRSDEGRSRGSR